MLEKVCEEKCKKKKKKSKWAYSSCLVHFYVKTSLEQIIMRNPHCKFLSYL